MPQGLRALQKLIKIIDEEMEAIGAEKIQMPSLVPQRLWEKTGTVQCIFTFPIYLYLLDVHLVPTHPYPTHPSTTHFKSMKIAHRNDFIHQICEFHG